MVRNSVKADVVCSVLRYEPAPVDNPLKGLVPYAGDVSRFFPHSMEFNYLPLSALVHGLGDYDWQPLEALLNDIAERGHQAIFRIFLEYPGKKGSVPSYLVRNGLTVHSWVSPDDNQNNETPDYQNPDLRKLLKDFLVAMGRRYDGDKRIGFITAGLLGRWGEWHTYPRTDLWASKDVQREVMDAYAAAFKITPVLLRYPVGEGDAINTANVARPFGYHDDSFAWATLNTGRKEDDWFFVPALHRSGAREKWKRFPIGGEIRPEAWGKLFDPSPGVKEIQDFARCVRETHATWLMDSGMFKANPADRRARAEEQVRRMGYEFHIPTTALSVEKGRVIAEARIVNRGIAPFYYDWPVEWSLQSVNGASVRTVRNPRHTLRGLLPQAPARVWTHTITTTGLPPGQYRVRLCVVNLLTRGKPLRFANAEQAADGWLTAGTVRLR